MKFYELPIGKFILFNNYFAVKINRKQIFYKDENGNEVIVDFEDSDELEENNND